MKSIKKGDLVLSIKNGADKAKVLKSELRGRVPRASAPICSTEKDIDEITQKKDIEEAITNAINIKKLTSR